MKRVPSAGSWCVGLVLALSALGCNPGGVGDPCTPEDEYQQGFNGFQVTETNVESRSFQCETRLCLVNHFQGRVSCRLGQGDPMAEGAPGPRCSIPGTKANPNDRDSKDNIKVEVPPQLRDRQTDQAVYCSCRCDGPDDKARYCECPEGFQCEPLVDDLKIPGGGGQLAGSYCIRAGSQYDSAEHFKAAPNCATFPNECGCDPTLPAEEYPAECGAQPTP
jgi:hypothetical protein